MEKKKLESEDLKRLQTLNNEASNIIVALGQIELEKSLMNNQKLDLLGKFTQLQISQESLSKELGEKYGDGTIDLISGEITELK
jgi:hypothetical protein